MAFVPAIVAGIAGVASIAQSVMGLTKKKEQPAQQPAPLPVAPTVDAAQTDAKAQMDKKRRISLLQGGNTDLTRGTALVGEESVGKKSLLGQ